MLALPAGLCPVSTARPKSDTTEAAVVVREYSQADGILFTCLAWFSKNDQHSSTAECLRSEVLHVYRG